MEGEKLRVVKLPLQEVDVLLQEAGGVPGQHQLLLVEVLLDDFPHLVGALEPQVDAGPQEGEVHRQHQGQGVPGDQEREAPHQAVILMLLEEK